MSLGYELADKHQDNQKLVRKAATKFLIGCRWMWMVADKSPNQGNKTGCPTRIFQQETWMKLFSEWLVIQSKQQRGESWKNRGTMIHDFRDRAETPRCRFVSITSHSEKSFIQVS